MAITNLQYPIVFSGSLTPVISKGIFSVNPMSTVHYDENGIPMPTLEELKDENRRLREENKALREILE